MIWKMDSETFPVSDWKEIQFASQENVFLLKRLFIMTLELFKKAYLASKECKWCGRTGEKMFV